MRDYVISDGELYHYGVVGMKWGVRRASMKTSSNERLKRKALDYDKKAANLQKKSEKAHAQYDLETSNKKAVKAAKLDAKAAKASKKALNADNEITRSHYERKAAKLEYKSSKQKIDADRISKSAGYGHKAMKYSIKSDRVAKKAAKARLKIANNQLYINKMNRKVSSLSKEELSGAYSFVKNLRDS